MTNPAPAPTVFALLVRETDYVSHLAPVDGGAFICGTKFGRSRWAVQGIVSGITDGGRNCRKCHQIAPYVKPADPLTDDTAPTAPVPQERWIVLRLLDGRKWTIVESYSTEADARALRDVLRDGLREPRTVRMVHTTDCA